MQGISLLAENRLASQEGLRSMEYLASKLRNNPGGRRTDLHRGESLKIRMVRVKLTNASVRCRS